MHKEQFHPAIMAANATLIVNGGGIGGFLAQTSGTITITSQQGIVFLNAFPVTAGNYLPIPMIFPRPGGGTIVLAGGASGLLLT